ncbi:hypothetical protein HORIV_21130 [Vreelandella olivaria]|uniref:Uncharacterized protein n=1 Tax=Vreelandella olivaria TaxID=390919 RepID=A0ABM8HNB6_9GAMM|nr:hypothetical protein HORIV_21130 [Halomonas olivaria]
MHMVTVTRDPERYRVLPGEGYDGVVKVTSGDSYGTGVLLYGGRAVLTAAHVVKGGANVAIQMDTLPDGLPYPPLIMLFTPAFKTVPATMTLPWCG